MIHPQLNDIGRWVVYTQIYKGAGYMQRDGVVAEIGQIVDYNPHVVFVRYNGQMLSKASLRENLRWYWMVNDPPHAWSMENSNGRKLAEQATTGRRLVAHHQV
jgi:hypothetical protein